MSLYQAYELADHKDVEKLNRLLLPAGIQIEQNLFEQYVLINMESYTSFMNNTAQIKAVSRPKKKKL